MLRPDRVGWPWAGGSSILCRMSDIGVLVWDERQPRQQEAYDNFLGNAIVCPSARTGRSGGAVGRAGRSRPGSLRRRPRCQPGARLVGPRAAPRRACRDRQEDPRPGDRGPAVTHCAALGALGHPVHRGDGLSHPRRRATAVPGHRRRADRAGVRPSGEPLPGSRRGRRGHSLLPPAQVSRAASPASASSFRSAASRHGAPTASRASRAPCCPITRSRGASPRSSPSRSPKCTTNRSTSPPRTR